MRRQAIAYPTPSFIEQLCVDSVLVNGQGQVWCPGVEAMKPYTKPGVVPERTAKGYARTTS